MSLPDLNEKHPVKLTVTMQAYTGNASTQYFKDLTQQTLNAQIPESAASKDYIFTNPENSFPLPVNFKKHFGHNCAGRWPLDAGRWTQDAGR